MRELYQHKRVKKCLSQLERHKFKKKDKEKKEKNLSAIQ